MVQSLYQHRSWSQTYKQWLETWITSWILENTRMHTHLIKYLTKSDWLVIRSKGLRDRLPSILHIFSLLMIIPRETWSPRAPRMKKPISRYYLKSMINIDLSPSNIIEKIPLITKLFTKLMFHQVIRYAYLNLISNHDCYPNFDSTEQGFSIPFTLLVHQDID